MYISTKFFRFFFPSGLFLRPYLVRQPAAGQPPEVHARSAEYLSRELVMRWKRSKTATPSGLGSGKKIHRPGKRFCFVNTARLL